MEQNQSNQPNQPKQPNLMDVGTRYQHLTDLKESIDECIVIMKEHSVSLAEKQKLGKFMIAAEVIAAHINAIADYFDYQSEYKLYQAIDSIPGDPAQIPGGRGTPLV